jgi:hypothetical protein
MTTKVPGKKELRDLAALGHTLEQQRRLNKQRLRKLQDRQKYQNGGVVEQAGLHDLPPVELLGALLFVKQMLAAPAAREETIKLGKRAMAEQAAKKREASGAPEVFIAFSDPPPPPLLQELKDLRLRFDRSRVEWRGRANLFKLQGVVRTAGWSRFVLRSGYVKS